MGAVYLSASATDPATLFGGTWERIQDRFLLCAGSTYAAGATGGEATHKLTVSEMPSHSHGMSKAATRANVHNVSAADTDLYGCKYADGLKTDSTGGNAAHNNMPPYLAVYAWKRVA